MPTPRFGTPRRPERKTWGSVVAQVADYKLGRPLLPWQQYAAEVSLEIDPDTGLLAYDVVIITVPRQSGKTTGVLFPVLVTRCTQWGQRQMAVYTAQDGNSARRKFENDFVHILKESNGFELGRDYTVRLGNNAPRILFRQTDSQLWPSATQSSSGHGDALDMPALDEIFEHEDPNIDQGFTPPMATREEAQKWLLSTAGTRKSTYLKDKRAMGRQAALDDSGYGVCYIEFSAGDVGSEEDWPETWVHDRELWWHVMPALGHTQTERKIETQLLELGPAGFMRAFGNVDDDSDDSSGSPIDIEEWSARVLDRGKVGVLDRIVFGLDIPPDRSRASIGMAGARSDGGYLLEVIDARAGTRWVIERGVELVEKHDAEGFAIDPGSPAGALIPDLEAAGVTVFPMGARQHAQACGALVDRIPTGEVFHLGQDELDDAVLDARTRPLGDAWAWDRKTPDADITPLVAVTLPLGALLAAAEAPKESVYNGRGFVEW